MPKFLRNLFGLEEAELPRALASIAMIFGLMFAAEIGRIGRDSYFLKIVGAGDIPVMYVYIAVIMLLLTAVYGPIVRRLGLQAMMVFLLALGGLLMGTFFYLIQLDAPLFSFQPHVIYCVIEAYALFVIVHFWSLISDIFSAAEGERVYPVLGSTALVATISGGFATRAIAFELGSNYLFLASAVVLLVLISVVRRLRQGADPEVQEKRVSAVMNDFSAKGIAGLRAIWREPLIRTLTYMAFPMWVIAYIIEYSYYDSLDRVFVDQDQLAGFMGMFVGICSGMALVFQLSVTPRIIRRFGVANASMIYPMTLTLGAICLLLFSLFPSALGRELDLYGIVMLVLLARFLDMSFYLSVWDSTSQLLFYAVSEESRIRARTFISGAIFPVSMASAGGALMAFSAVGEPVYNVAFVAVALGFLLLILGLNLTPDYLKALLSNIDPRNKGRRAEILQELSGIASSDTRYVLLQSVSAKDIEEARFALDQLLKDKDDELLEDLAEAVGGMKKELAPELLAHLTETDRQRHPDLYRSLRAMESNGG